MIEAVPIVVTSIKSVINTITAAIPISLDPVAFFVEMPLDAVALPIESLG